MKYEIKMVHRGDEWENYDVTVNGETRKMCYTGCGPNPGYYSGYLHDGDGTYLEWAGEPNAEAHAVKHLFKGGRVVDRGRRW